MASKNIVLKGATYNGVESITLPTSPSGDATFYEVSDTTATAADVLNSKYFYTAGGVKTQGTATASTTVLTTKTITVNGTYDAEDDNADGYSSVTVNVSGGGGGDSWSWMGKNPTKVKEYTNKFYLKDTGYAAWTPSTTSTQIEAGSALESYAPADFNNYDYVVYGEMHTHFEYGSGATGTAQMLEYFSSWSFDIYRYYSTLSSLIAGVPSSSRVGTASNQRMGRLYLDTSGIEQFATTSYGVYAYAIPSINYQNNQITPYLPQINARCSSSSFSTTNAAAVDQDASYYEIVTQIWRVDIGTNSEGAVAEAIHEMYLDTQ